MNLQERARQVEEYRGHIRSKSVQLGQLYADLGCTPTGMTVPQHIEVIEEDNHVFIAEAVWAGGMDWIYAAGLALDGMDDMIRDDWDE